MKCTKCGQMVSDRAEMCPNCGCSIKKKIVCEECGETIEPHDRICPKCGCPTSESESVKTNESPTTVNQKNEQPTTAINELAGRFLSLWHFFAKIMYCLAVLFVISGFIGAISVKSPELIFFVGIIPGGFIWLIASFMDGKIKFGK